jgi:hypothetical protein
VSGIRVEASDRNGFSYHDEVPAARLGIMWKTPAVQERVT